MEKIIHLEESQFVPVNTTVQQVILDEEMVVEVRKSEKLMIFDENTYAKINDMSFKNGEISVSVRSQLLPDAPDFARGFIGLAFRIQEDDSQFESFYVRPTNGNHSDPIRANRAVQYFAYPDYKFDYFREVGITDFEAPADIALDEWINLKIKVIDEQAVLYVNDKETLRVNALKLGGNVSGSLGLFVDIGTRGFFKNLKVKVYD